MGLLWAACFSAVALLLSASGVFAQAAPADDGSASVATTTPADDGTTSVVAPTPPDGTTAVAASTPALSGQVLVAGRCPVPIGGFGGFARGGSRTCPDRPFPTTLLIRSADTDAPVASLATASDGSFSVALAPGRYLIDPLLADGNPPATSSISVAVPDDGWVTIRVTGGSAARVP